VCAELQQTKARTNKPMSEEEKKTRKHKIVVCLVAKNEHDYLPEWVVYHLAIGVDHFYIYDNGDEGTRPLEDAMQGKFNDCCTFIPFPERPCQLRAYSHFLINYAQHTDWVAFIDADEFIVPKKSPNLRAFVDEHSHLPVIGLNWHMFWHNFHHKRPEGFVIDNYTRAHFNKHIKTLAQTSWLRGDASEMKNCVHNVFGCARRIDGSLIRGPFNEVDNTDIICINHYWTKSIEEWRAKVERGRATTNNPKHKRSDPTWAKWESNPSPIDNDLLDLHREKFALEWQRRLGKNDQDVQDGSDPAATPAQLTVVPTI